MRARYDDVAPVFIGDVDTLSIKTVFISPSLNNTFIADNSACMIFLPIGSSHLMLAVAPS
jgi:hypothetical protein